MKGLLRLFRTRARAPQKDSAPEEAIDEAEEADVDETDDDGCSEDDPASALDAFQLSNSSR